MVILKQTLAISMLVSTVQALVVEIPTKNGIYYENIDETKWKIDPSLIKYVNSDTREVNRTGKRIYQFNYAKIGVYYLSGDEKGNWYVLDEFADPLCFFKIRIFPSKRDATKAALDANRNWESGGEPGNQANTRIDEQDGALFIRYKPAMGSGKDIPIEIVTKKGVLLFDFVLLKNARNFLLTVEDQKKLSLQIIDLVLSGKIQKCHEQDSAAIKAREADNYRLINLPGYRMNPSVGDAYIKNRLFISLPEGNRTFRHPESMWNRPCLEWYEQFQKNITQKKKHMNKRGDIVGLDIPKSRGMEGYRCGVTIAHTISEYDALRFMEGFALGSDLPYGDTQALQRRIDQHSVDRASVGEHNLILKPQLDHTGSLIPNVEESRICFVRNNTAVRVVADRPDVSVLWIAKKIDEELIAAGKGEPPTWSPPRKRTPAPAARQQPVAVPSKQH